MSDQVLVPSGITPNQIRQFCDQLTNRYQFAFNELRSINDTTTIEENASAKREHIQELCLDLSQDLAQLVRFKIDNPGDYYLKFVDPVISYLRELRQLITLYKDAEKM